MSNESIILLTAFLVLLIGFIVYMIFIIKALAKNRKEARRKLFTQEYPVVDAGGLEEYKMKNKENENI